jgi:predicted nucleotidyltransferase
MSLPANLLREEKGLSDWCVLHGYRGSIAHGMYEPPTNPLSIDDKDTMAICVPPIGHYFGLSEYGSKGTREIKHDEWDIVVYEARKAIRMLGQGNPNILSLLWLPSTSYIRRSPAGFHLLDNRDLFVGKHVYHSFVGYAKGQLHKMTHGAHQGYMGEKRKALVQQFGYDTKNAAHLIRLLRMGIEFLIEGNLRVDRGGVDATELLDIKHGHLSLEEVQSKAHQLFRLAEEAYVRSTLPQRPDAGRVNELCVEVVSLAFPPRAEEKR